MAAGLGECREGGAIEDAVDEDGLNGDRTGDADAVNLLNATLAKLTAGEVGDLDLPADDEKLTAFEEGTGHGRDDVGEAGAGCDESEGAARGGDLVEVLGCNAGSDLVDHWDACEIVAAALEQVHDVSAGDEEAVRVAEFGEPGWPSDRYISLMFIFLGSRQVLRQVVRSVKRSMLSEADSIDPKP